MQTAYIGMGSNLASPAGPPDATLAAAVARLASFGQVAARSSLYSTKPVGFTDQPRFTNAVVALETELAPQTLLAALLDLERAFGRNRSEGFQNGPRTLDLDILLMGDIQSTEPGLQIPHPRLADRAFVLIPLNEIAPRAVHPVHRKTVAQLLDSLRKSRESETNEVVPIESAPWSLGAGSAAAEPASPLRAKASEPHRHGDR
ncbi:MAG: 2-amino-4-hydroxy-6-hydroxymethyldihydropteridine diphosphokinase [Terracidiphilus sp.]